LNARKEKTISSLSQCNYRIFVCPGQEPEIHLLGKVPAKGQLRRLAGTGGFRGGRYRPPRFLAPDESGVSNRRVSVMATRSRRILAKTFIGIGRDDRRSRMIGTSFCSTNLSISPQKS
jgi:hypothetical protein